MRYVLIELAGAHNIKVMPSGSVLQALDRVFFVFIPYFPETSASKTQQTKILPPEVLASYVCLTKIE